MLLTDLNSARSELYVPGASIALEDSSLDMRQTHKLVFTQVEVDLELTKGSTFRFTIPRAFDNERGDFFTPAGEPLMPLFRLGTRIWIRMGYGGLEAQKLLFSGFVTQVSTGFAEGGAPDLEVAGQDVTYKMTLGSKQHRLQDKGVREAVNEVAQDNSVSLKFSGEDPPKDIPLDANLQTDLEFLIKLAELFSKSGKKWDFFVRPKLSGTDELYFQPRSTEGNPFELRWGAELLSFKPEIDIARQVQKVKVHGWDELGKQAFEGEAVAKSKAGEKTGGQIQQEAFGRETVLELRLPVKSLAEANQRAEAALAERALALLKGEGETFGQPDLLPNSLVKVIGIGQQFSDTYYVTKTVHRYDTSGYRTRFSVEKSTA